MADPPPLLIPHRSCPPSPRRLFAPAAADPPPQLLPRRSRRAGGQGGRGNRTADSRVE